jgi:hypothetical protein
MGETDNFVPLASWSLARDNYVLYYSACDGGWDLFLPRKIKQKRLLRNGAVVVEISGVEDYY